MSDIELPGTPNEQRNEGLLTDGEKAVAVEAVKRLITFLAANGKAVSFVRYAVMAACGHEAAVSDSTIGQTAACVVGAATVAWSWWERHQQAHEAAARRSGLPPVHEIRFAPDNDPAKDRP